MCTDNNLLNVLGNIYPVGNICLNKDPDMDMQSTSGRQINIDSSIQLLTSAVCRQILGTWLAIITRRDIIAVLQLVDGLAAEVTVVRVVEEVLEEMMERQVSETATCFPPFFFFFSFLFLFSFLQSVMSITHMGRQQLRELITTLWHKKG